MRAARVSHVGGPDVIEIFDLPTPAPGAGELLVRVEHAGVNFIDVYHRMGRYAKPLPFVLGEEGAGTVVAAGPGADPSLGPGARVAWASAPGGYATHAVIAAERAVPVPHGIDTRDAAALVLQGMTAHYLARSTFPLAPGHTCVVYAAAGGVGLLLVQLARAAGARVIGVTSTDAKAEAARAAGCERVVRAADVVAAARDATGGRGADVVYDSVGADTFLASLDALAPRGLLVLFGQSSGPVPPIDLQLLSQKGSLFATRPTLRHYVLTRAELLARAADVLGAFARGALALTIDRELPLAQAADAHRLLESRTTSGKLLLDCR
jgi:NADPH2:quinone reductase